MKLNYFVAALTATIVSALPTSNTTTTVKNSTSNATSTCRKTTLTWSIAPMTSSTSYNFALRINYQNGQPDHLSMWDADVRNNRATGLKLCHSNHIWCVEFDGYLASERVKLIYGGQDRYYDHPNKRTPMGTDRDSFQYWDCIPW